MATDITLPPTGLSSSQPGPDDLPADWPARPARGPAKLLRMLIGVREDVMDRASEDRTKYAWLGAIVLNTAILGGISMAVAVSTVRAELATPVKVLIAAVWFWVVLALDSWLISSTHGVNRRRLLMLVPRLLLSVLLSLFIAEPLLLQIFHSEIQSQITHGAQKARDDYKGHLVACNPADGSVDLTPGCQPYQLHVAGSPAELGRQVAKNAADVTAAQNAVDAYDAKIGVMQQDENKQCDISNFVWRSDGNREESDPCLNIQTEIRNFQKANDINALTDRLAKAKDAATTLNAQEAGVATAYQTALQTALDGAVATMKAGQDTTGLLTRADALAVISWSTWYAGFIVVLLHLMLLVVDAMPVLAKVMSGPTKYDEALGRRQEGNRVLHEMSLDLERACAYAEFEYERHQHTKTAEARKRRIEHDLQIREAERAREFRAELDARTARILRDRG